MQAAQSYRLTAAYLAAQTVLLGLFLCPTRAPAQKGSFAVAQFATVGSHQENLAGTYVGRASSKDAARRVFTLDLAQNGSAILTTLYVGKDTVAESGHWNQSGSQLVLTFDPIGPNAPPGGITFRYQRAALHPIHWDASEWGEEGPPVLRRDLTSASPAGF